MLSFIKNSIKNHYFKSSYCLDVGELYCPQCGVRFADVQVGQIPLPSTFKEEVECPKCHTKLGYEFSFSADFPCSSNKFSLINLLKNVIIFDPAEIKYIYRLFLMSFTNTPHHIEEHSDVERKDTLNFEKVFFRKCVCGKQILLKQRRLM